MSHVSRRGYLPRTLAAASMVAVCTAVVAQPESVSASPAPVPGPVTINATGPYSGTVPDGVCAMQATVRGGAGGSSIAVPNANGAGAAVTATHAVLPGQSYSGIVGGGGSGNTAGNVSLPGGSNGGGDSGTITGPNTIHPGGGGGGWSDLNVAGQSLIVAGGGGGSGGGHASDGGVGGNGGLPGAAGVTAGSVGQHGFDTPAASVGGGGGGQTAAPGAGGVHGTTAARNGFAGSGQTGGDGGNDTTPDSGGGGGGGVFGGGGGASTVGNGSTAPSPGAPSGAGGGGGSSSVAATSPDGSTAVTGVSSAPGPKLGAAGNGAPGQVQLQWLPCDYDLAVTKSAAPGTVAPGGTITWAVGVTNLGPDPMTKGDTVTLTDTLPGAGAKTITSISTSGGGGGPLSSGAVTCSAGVGAAMPATLTCSRPYGAPGAPGSPSGGVRGLDVGETLTVTYTQPAQAADVGTLLNTATVDDRTTGDSNDTADASVTVFLPNPSITLDKQAGTINDLDANGHDVGDTIDFTFLVTNTGNVTLDPVTVTDPMVGAVSCPVSDLDPGDFTTCTATYVLTQADVNAGVVNNTATASGTPPTGPPVTDDDNTSTPVTRTAAITLDKQAGTINDLDANGHDVGDTIDFTFLVTNTGNVTLDPVTVTDPMVGAVSCPVSDLDPGDFTTCTATYVLTQADVDAGVVNNTATASGTPPTGPPVTDDDNTSTPVTRTAAITLDKQAGTINDLDANGHDVGDTIDFTFLVTNTGNVTLDPVTVTDPMVGAVSCPVSDLDPGDFTTCTATYVLTQADVDAGVVNNTATASGTPPTGPPVTDDDNTSTPVTRTAAITLDKQAGIPSGNTVGSTIAFTFLVTNTGNVTLDPISVNDPAVGAVSCPVTALDPGDFTTCTATYVLTPLDVDSGHFANSATATGTPPPGVTPPTADDDTDTPIPAGPAIDLDKQAGTINDLDANGHDVGDTIDFTFIVTNTGNVTLDPVTVTDPMVGAVSCPGGPLAAAAQRTCTATYILTQADVNAGVVNNTATASGTPPTGPPVTDDDNTSTPVTRTAAITLDKQAGTINDLDANGHDVGDTIDFTFLVTNTGNVTLDPVTVTDPMVGAVSCPVSDLDPGDFTTCTATYVLTQADVDAGVVNNTATASGTPPTGPPVTDDDNTSTPVTRTAAITLDKQAGIPSGNTVGSTIAFTFLVTNTGNVTLDPITVNDPAVGAVTCPAGPLAPTASTTCTATYVLTPLDVDSGHFANSATATGTPPPGVTPPTADDDTDTPIPAGPAIDLDKQAGTINDLDANGHDVGDTIDFTFIVTNTGNVTLDPVTVTDPMVGAVSCPGGPLAAAAQRTCTATYILTQADVNAGVVNNTATASGTPPTGPPVTDDDNTSTPVTRTAAITLDKQAGTINDLDANGPDVGDTIDFTFLVTNTGNVTLDPISVNDPAVGAVSCPVTDLDPGDSTTCTATYALTQLDVDSGHFANTATATGTPPPGVTPPTADDDTDTPIPAGPAISLDKQAGTINDLDANGPDVGDTIDYTFIVTNTGNVTLTSVSVTDPMVGAVSCPAGSLAPGAQRTCTATYILTQADVDAGVVDNTATTSGTPPTGPPVTDDDTVTTSIPANPSITLVKSAGPITDVDANGPDAGDTIAYSFLVTNTGNVTLDPVSVADPKVGAVTCPAGPLAPTASRTCTATYTLTQADVDSGSVVNTATASGTPPTGPPVTDVDTITTTVPTTPRIDLQKTASTTGPVHPGDQIIFSFTVTNTGNVTLTNLQVQDPMVGTVTCATTTLAPGAQTTCTAAPYTVTPADVAAGNIVNKATATADGGGGVKVNSEDQVEVLAAAAADPSIRLVKRADTAGPVRAGDEVTYTFTVTNTGNMTLTRVRVQDPMLGTVECRRTRLKPGQSTTCSAPPYTVTAADVRDGTLVNHASVTGKACGPALAECVVVDDADTVRLGVATSGGLPDTGSTVSPVTVGVGLGLLGLGTALLFAGRRPRKRETR